MNARILLIEDTEDLGEMIRDILSMEGYQVSWARDGREGLRLFLESRFDLLITDIVMPHLNGLELTRAIQVENGLAKTPIIILSARTSPEDQAIGYAAGATVYLKKPCSSVVLLESIHALLSFAR